VTEPYRDAVRTLLRDRLLDAAAQAFTEEGWRRVTMAKVGDRAGVSRQTVYNEFGTKQQLAEQLIMRELEIFLGIVSERFAGEDELVPAVQAAIEGALQAAHEHSLLHSLLESEQAGDTELLPFLVQSQWLIDRATEFLAELMLGRFPDVPLQGAHLTVALESVVRLVLSHITRPSRTAEETAADLAFVVAAVIEGAPSVAASGTLSEATA